jgi:hypothetical protein
MPKKLAGLSEAEFEARLMSSDVADSITTFGRYASAMCSLEASKLWWATVFVPLLTMLRAPGKQGLAAWEPTFLLNMCNEMLTKVGRVLAGKEAITVEALKSKLSVAVTINHAEQVTDYNLHLLTKQSARENLKR